MSGTKHWNWALGHTIHKKHKYTIVHAACEHENLRSIHINVLAQKCRRWLQNVLEQKCLRSQCDDPKPSCDVGIIVVLQILRDLVNLCDPSVKSTTAFNVVCSRLYASFAWCIDCHAGCNSPDPSVAPREVFFEVHLIDGKCRVGVLMETRHTYNSIRIKSSELDLPIFP